VHRFAPLLLLTAALLPAESAAAENVCAEQQDQARAACLDKHYPGVRLKVQQSCSGLTGQPLQRCRSDAWSAHGVPMARPEGTAATGGLAQAPQASPAGARSCAGLGGPGWMACVDDARPGLRASIASTCGTGPSPEVQRCQARAYEEAGVSQAAAPGGPKKGAKRPPRRAD